jgi:hypothetical protein
MKFHTRLRVVLLALIVLGILFTWMWAVRQVFPGNPAFIVPAMYQGTPPETNPWLEPWQRWDTPHYQAIASRGYDAFESALFTPPLYPLLMRFGASLFAGNTLASGLFISALSMVACLIVFFQIARFELGDQQVSFRATLFLACFPTAFFLPAAYSESLFLLCAMLSLFNARKHHWLAAGLWGALAALTRTPGSFLVFPLAYAAWKAWQLGDRRGWLAPFLTGMGALIYPLYVWIGLGRSPLAILDALNARGGHLAFPGWNIIQAASRVLHGNLIEENIIELAFSILFIILTIFIWKKLPLIYGVYAATLMLLFLSRIGSPQPLVSMARYVMEIFPAFLILGLWAQKPWVYRLILYLSWLGLVFFSAQFAIWGWVG